MAWPPPCSASQAGVTHIQSSRPLHMGLSGMGGSGEEGAAWAGALSLPPVHMAARDQGKVHLVAIRRATKWSLWDKVTCPRSSASPLFSD